VLELIGRYRIHEQIGEGAMADVYRAHDPHIDRPLAIKVLKAEYRQDREYAARFLREARAAGALSHPGIVTVFDVGEVDGFPFIVMELLDGEPLSEVLRRGPMPPSQVIPIAIQLVDALAYAHGQGVIHRDIKPSNIILSPDGRSLKLLDFGIAQLAEADPVAEADSYKTQIGQVIGTPRYMSPEQALGRELDVRSDIYSIGIVLYEMLSGRRAFGGGSAAAVTAQIVNVDPAPLAEVAPNTPRGLQFIVGKAIAKQPAQRFADAARLSDALRRELSVAQVVAREAAAQRSYLPLQVRLTLLMALITAIVLAIAVGTVLSRQRAAMRGVALSSGNAISAFVANNAALRAVDNAALPADQQDWVPVQAFVQNAAADPNLRGLLVTDAGGVVRAAIDQSLIGRPYRAPTDEPLVADRDGVTIRAADGGQSFRFVRPITYAGRSFGTVDLRLNQAILRSAARVSTWLLVLLAVVTLGTVALVSFLSARLLQAPITRLGDALMEIARGNLDFRISHSRQDEFGELFDGVNLVAQSTQERQEAVEALLLDRPAPTQSPPPPPPPPPPAEPPVAEPLAASSEPTPFTRPMEPDEASEPLGAAAPAMEDVAPEPPAEAVEEPEPVIAPPEPEEAAEPAQVEEPEPPQEMLAPPWPHDEDEDRTLVDPQDEQRR